jgi:fatty acid desaturase
MKTSVLVRLVTLTIIVVALFLLPRFWGWSGLPMVVIATLLVVTFFLVRYHARHTGYRCPECSHTFVISPVTDFLSPHLGGVKMLRCPTCGHSTWCLEIDRREVSGSQPTATPSQTTPAQGGRSLRIQITVVLIIYCGLWVYTLYLWPLLPESVSSWTALKIPLVTIILPLLQVTFCTFALRHGYRSRIYFVVSLFVIAFLALAVWMQRTILLKTF